MSFSNLLICGNLGSNAHDDQRIHGLGQHDDLKICTVDLSLREELEFDVPSMPFNRISKTSAVMAIWIRRTLARLLLTMCDLKGSCTPILGFSAVAINHIRPN